MRAHSAFRADPCPDPHPAARDLGSLHDYLGQVRQQKAQAGLMTA